MDIKVTLSKYFDFDVGMIFCLKRDCLIVWNRMLFEFWLIDDQFRIFWIEYYRWEINLLNSELYMLKYKIY